MSRNSYAAMRGLTIDLSRFSTVLATAIFAVHLLGRAQIWGDVAEAAEERRARGPAFGAIQTTASFAPLPFPEAIDFFRAKLTLRPADYAMLEDLAKAKAFSIAAGATEQITESIRELIDRAETEGIGLREFQAQAARVLDRAGVSARTPWYWETVYRTNLQSSYQAGRWKQMQDPFVKQQRPYLRYISARVPTTRASHLEKHGRVYPIDHKFWDTWMVPNGFNCIPSRQVINTARGAVPIEQVIHGDLVLTHQGRWRPVTELHRNLFVGHLVRIMVSDGRVVRMTPNHKVFTRRGWVEAAGLNTHDEIGDLHSCLIPGADTFCSPTRPSITQQQSGNVDIAQIEQEPFSGLVYNLGVEEDHSYCVDGLALHNCLCTVISASEAEMKREGWQVSTATWDEPDTGFAVNVGKTEDI